MERYVFDTTQGEVLEAMDEAALMDYARIRANALRPCIVVAVLTLGCCIYFALKGDVNTIGYTLLVGMIIIGFFALPLRNTKRFRAGVRAAREQRENLTNKVRTKRMRFVFEGDSCRMLDGKDEEVQAWENVAMTVVWESDRLFWLPMADTAVLLPKGCMTEGTEDAFRGWLQKHSKKYRHSKVTDRLRRSLES